MTLLLHRVLLLEMIREPFKEGERGFAHVVVRRPGGAGINTFIVAGCFF